LVVIGTTTSGCVRATVVDAFSLNYRVILAEEGCFDRSEASHAVSLCDMHVKYADIISTAEILSYFDQLGQRGRRIAHPRDFTSHPAPTGNRIGILRKRHARTISASAPSPTLRGVHHLALCTDVMNATIDFYVELLGTPPSVPHEGTARSRRSSPEWGLLRQCGLQPVLGEGD
jgi:hypothetical protein